MSIRYAISIPERAKAAQKVANRSRFGYFLLPIFLGLLVFYQDVFALPILTDFKVTLRPERTEVTDANDDDNGVTDGVINLRDRNLNSGGVAQVKIISLDVKSCEHAGFMGICLTTAGEGNSFEALVEDPAQVGIDVTGMLDIRKYDGARIDLSGTARGSGSVTQIEWFGFANNNRVKDPNHMPFTDRIRYDNFGPLSKSFSDLIIDRNNKGNGPVTLVGVFDLNFGSGNPNRQTLRLPDSAFVGVRPVSEPSTLALLNIGTCGLLLFYGRRRGTLVSNPRNRPNQLNLINNEAYRSQHWAEGYNGSAIHRAGTDQPVSHPPSPEDCPRQGCPVSIPLPFRRCSLVALAPYLVVALSLTLAPAPGSANGIGFDEPPAERGSSLSGLGQVVDRAFAQTISEMLGAKGVDSSIFLFQQCYGGGMLDELKTSLNPLGTKWVGGSASRYDQYSFGQDSLEEYAKKEQSADQRDKQIVAKLAADPALKAEIVTQSPMNFWTRELIGQLTAEEAPTLGSAITEAANRDKFGTSAGAGEKDLATVYGKQQNETGQLLFANGGDGIRLSGGAASSRHAFIWLDSQDRVRHEVDALAFIDLLIGKWGKPSDQVSLTVFASNPSRELAQQIKNKTGSNPKIATLNSLKTEASKLKDKLGPQEQFLFYSTGHGGWQNRADTLTIVPSQSHLGIPLGLSQEQIDGMAMTNDNSPSLSLGFSNLNAIDKPIDLFLGSTDIGDIFGTEDGTGIFTINIREDLLYAGTALTLVNDNAHSVHIDSYYLDSGAITDFLPAAVPEPPTSWLLLTAALFWLAGKPASGSR